MSATYGAVHKALRRERGPAQEWCCARCSLPAEQWACVANKTVEGQHGPTRVRYSADLADYLPLCMMCHKQEDHGATCPSGHDDFAHQGWHRYCRECKRQKALAHYYAVGRERRRAEASR